MTPPALVLLPPRFGAPLPLACQLDALLTGLRDDLVVRTATDDRSLSAEVADLVDAGAGEVICLPLHAAGTSPAPELSDAVARLQEATPDALVSLADPLGAPGGCFAAVDRALAQALAAGHARELDALILWHDAPHGVCASALERRARRWAAHHRLPHRVASIAHPATIDEAVAAHRREGHRNIGIATMAILVEPQLLAHAARLPGVRGVGRPLGADRAVAEAVLSQYAIAALRTLELPLAS